VSQATIIIPSSIISQSGCLQSTSLALRRRLEVGDRTRARWDLPQQRRKRDMLLQLLKPPSLSRSISPSRSGSDLQQGPSPNPSDYLPPPQQSSSSSPSSSVVYQAAPHDPSAGGGSSPLWTKAYYKLPDELRNHLGVADPGAMNQLETLQNVLNTAIQAKEANMGNRLKINWGGKEIDFGETAEKLVN